MSIIAEDISFMIEYFRSLPEYESEEMEPNIELGDTCAETDSSMEDKPDYGSDSVDDKSKDEEEAKPEAMLGADDEEPVDSDDDIEAPWYKDRMDVQKIGDILVGFFMEKIKLSLIEQAADIYVASKNELTNQHHKRRRLLLDPLEYPVFNVKNSDRAIFVTLVKLLLSGQQEYLLSEADAAGRDILEALVKNIVVKIAEKVRPVIVKEYIETKKKRWIELCGTYGVDKLIKFSHIKNSSFYINLRGFYEKEVGEAGFGVIIREFRGNPIAVYSEYICDKEKQVSSFYHELQGVNKGLELAVGSDLKDVLIFCTHSDIGFLVMSCQAYENQCRCDKVLKPVEKRCERCVGRCVLFCQEAEMDKTEIEMIYRLLIKVMDNLLKLGREKVSVMGHPSFNTGSLNYLAKLKENKGEIALGDLKHHPDLREILFQEASGELGSKDGFSISLFC